MATTRTLTSDRPGPVTLDVDVTSQDVIVVVDPKCTVAAVQVSTRDDSGQSADIVNKAKLSQRGDTLSVDLSSAGTVIGGGSVQTNVFGPRRTVVSNVAGGVFVGGDNFSVISTGGGVTIVNGQVISGDAVVIAGGSPVRVTATLPAGSVITSRTASGSLTVKGPAKAVVANTASGDIEIEGDVLDLDLNTASGDIDIAGAAGFVRARTASGDITVDRVTRIEATTASGDITVKAMAGRAQLSTASGDVNMTAVHGAVSANITTASGDITTRGERIEALTTNSFTGRVRNR